LFLLSPGNSKDLNDEELLRKYRSSEDMALLGELYSRYMHLVYGLCLKYLASREEAKDAVIQIFEILSEKILKHDIRHFKSWLYVLSKNYCLMQIRSVQARDKRNRIWIADFMESEPEMHPIDDDNMRLNIELKDCISKLDINQKKCIELFYFDNKCYKEIAEILKMSDKKVKSHLQNGKRNLKICLDQKHVREE
jgi:RNA polymerase sigma-70 factor (ECF subfamily)